VIEGPPPGTYWRVRKEKFSELDSYNRIWWGEDGNNTPAIKRFLSEVKQGLVPETVWFYEDVGHTQDAKKELLPILSFATSEDVFVTPKPSRLIERVLQLATNEDSIILESFAGSGTTAHAVLSLNHKDGGNRRFILVECEDYADTLTAERVRRQEE
jgi:adenine-specific DNA-methyltransferase